MLSSMSARLGFALRVGSARPNFCLAVELSVGYIQAYYKVMMTFVWKPTDSSTATQKFGRADPTRSANPRRADIELNMCLAVEQIPREASRNRSLTVPIRDPIRPPPQIPPTTTKSAHHHKFGPVHKSGPDAVLIGPDSDPGTQISARRGPYRSR